MIAYLIGTLIGTFAGLGLVYLAVKALKRFSRRAVRRTFDQWDFTGWEDRK